MSVTDRMVLYFPFSAILSLGSVAGELEDICCTSPAVGMKDAGGPLGVGAPGLCIATADGDAIDVLTGGG